VEKKSRSKVNDHGITIEDIDEDMEKHITGGPNRSMESKVEQLRLQQRLDEAYRTGALKGTNIMSYYLEGTRELRKKLLDGLASPPIDGVPQFRVGTGFNKFLASMAFLVDRGYANDSAYYPNLNRMYYPAFMGGRSQFGCIEMERDAHLKSLRWVSEAIHSRPGQLFKTLRGTIPFQHYARFPDLVQFAYAMANFVQPYYRPDDWEEYTKSRGV
jgi:hypothetical protein